MDTFAPQLYTKKPVVIEAIRFAPEGHNADVVFLWAHGNGCKLEWSEGNQSFEIHTLEGRMQLTVGNWLIKGVEGEFYPCKHSVFVESYGAS